MMSRERPTRELKNACDFCLGFYNYLNSLNTVYDYIDTPYLLWLKFLQKLCKKEYKCIVLFLYATTILSHVIVNCIVTLNRKLILFPYLP